MKKKVTISVIGALVFLGLCSGVFAAWGGGYYGYGWRPGYGWNAYYPFAYYPFPYPYPYGYPWYPSYPSYPSGYSQPPVYIEPEQPYYWYHCKDPQGYYPYVENCPTGWMRVVPTPPPPEREGVKK